MEVGPPKRRRRSSSARTPFSLKFAPVTEATLALFRDFFITDLVYGTLPFTMDHPVTEESGTWQFLVEGAYSVTPIGEDAYQIDAEMELLS